MVNWAMEIRVRAERRAGELLKAIPKNVGANGSKVSGTKQVPVRDPTTKLADLGISKNDSSRWQQLARIPEPEFESRIEERKASGSQDLPHGEFTAMIQSDLQFSARTAQRYMAIAGAFHLEKRRSPTVLPSAWYTLDVLRRLEPSVFEKAVESGKVHTEMTQADAEALLPAKHVAPVVPLSDGALREGGKLIAEYVAEEAALDRIVAELGDRVQPSPETRAAEAVAGEVLTQLRRVHALLQTVYPKPQFNYRWAEASRLASSILKQVEALS